MAAINFLTKNHPKLLKYFDTNSYISGFENNEFKWDGDKSLKIMTPVLPELNTYDRDWVAPTNGNYGGRFGPMTEIKDTIQTLTMKQEDSFHFSIDRGNYNDQEMKKSANEMLRLEIKDKMVPKRDKYCIKRWCEGAGHIAPITISSGKWISKTAVVEALFDARATLDNDLVPSDNRVLFVPISLYKNIKLAPEFIGNDNLAGTVLHKGQVGAMLDGSKVICVPDRYFPEGVQFMLIYKRSVCAPKKFDVGRVLTEDFRVDGWVCQGHNYYDAFVLNAIRNGVYVACKSDKICEKPTVAIASHAATISAGSTDTGATFYYTLDGSDPRDEENPARQVYNSSSKPATTAGQTIKVYGTVAGKLPSAVVEATDE